MDLNTLKSAIRGDARTNQQSPMATQGNVKPRIGKHKKKPSMELKIFLAFILHVIVTSRGFV